MVKVKPIIPHNPHILLIFNNKHPYESALLVRFYYIDSEGSIGKIQGLLYVHLAYVKHSRLSHVTECNPRSVHTKMSKRADR